MFSYWITSLLSVCRAAIYSFSLKGGKKSEIDFFSFLNLYVLCVHFLCSFILCIVGYTAFGRSVGAFKVSSNITAIVTVDYYY